MRTSLHCRCSLKAHRRRRGGGACPPATERDNPGVSREGGLAFPTMIPFWPPLGNEVISAVPVDGTTVRINAHPHGRLSVDIDQQRTTFQPIAIPARACLIFCVEWSDRAARLSLGGRGEPEQLLIDPWRVASTLEIDAMSGEAPRPKLFPALRVPDGATDEERFFLETIRDIDEKQASRDP